MPRTLAPSHPCTLAALLLTVASCLLPSALGAQESNSDTARINERVRSLQREAERLAGESRTLVGDLRKREIDRDLKIEQLKQAQLATSDAERSLQATTKALSELELRRVSELPDVQAQLVDVYKRGRSGYARLLFSAGDVRAFARATRAVGALTAIREQRIADHRRTLDALRQQRASFEQRAREYRAREADARRAKALADAAVASAGELLRQIDSRRDLTAQYIGELQVAYNRIEQQVAALGTSRARGNTVPLRPFQGALEWPVAGPVLGAFGRSTARLGGSIARNGMEIGAAEDASVRAIHEGTVGFAGPFTGFGTLVILDHGSNIYSLYGYLASTGLQQGAAVEGGAEVGRVGLAPAGPPALYFEMRIDGRSVNPLQWLKPR